MKPFAARYVDFGKVFVPNGALDFSTLASSDPEVGRFGAHLFNRGLLFPETSAFAGQIGLVTAALLMFEGGYLFTVVQRRREGELSAAPRTDRPFNQARFVLLSRDDVAAAFASRTALYTGLASAARDPAATVWLTDFTAVAEAQPWAPVLPRLDPHAPGPEAVRFLVNAVMSAAERVAPAAPGTRTATLAQPHMRHPQPISVPLPGQNLLEKLKLVEAVQYWLLPRLGVLTFALDYVSVQNVHLRLFQLPPDAPAPLPADRIFHPGAAAPRAVEDIYSPLAALSHEALYDAQLPELLALPVAAADAVILYTVEKQGVPLPGPEALRLYPDLARLGDRRLNLLRRVPREAALELLRQPDLPLDLRLDLLQVAFDAAHGQLGLYAPVHLAAPRPARDYGRNIAAAGADVEKREAVDYLRPKQAIQAAHHAAIIAQEPVDDAQIAQIVLQQLPGLAGQVHHFLFITALHLAAPLAITRAEFFEPKPMQLHSAMSTDFAMPRLGM